MASPIPKRGCRIKSVPIISAAPSKANASPRQKPPDNFRLRMSQVPNATQSGDVFPSSVALDAVVNEREAVHNPRSQAVNTPASRGTITDREWIKGFVFVRGKKNGNNKKTEKNRRKNAV